MAVALGTVMKEWMWKPRVWPRTAAAAEVPTSIVTKYLQLLYRRQYRRHQRQQYQQQQELDNHQRQETAWSGGSRPHQQEGWRDLGFNCHGRGQTAQAAHGVLRGKFKLDLVGQSAAAISDRRVWMCNSGASDYMTGDATNVFHRRAPSKGQEWVTIGDGAVTKVLFVATLNLKLHCGTDVGVQLPRV